MIAETEKRMGFGDLQTRNRPRPFILKRILNHNNLLKNIDWDKIINLG